MIILALSICSLFKFSTLVSVLFTVIFSLCGYAAVIYFKLKFAFYEDECEYIRQILSKIVSAKNKIVGFFREKKSSNSHAKKVMF